MSPNLPRVPLELPHHDLGIPPKVEEVKTAHKVMPIDEMEQKLPGSPGTEWMLLDKMQRAWQHDPQEEKDGLELKPENEFWMHV
ncbi:UNVERIFIED_CONTAM: hypothetical protein K2H54_044766 [Gekko kuhli]